MHMCWTFNITTWRYLANCLGFVTKSISARPGYFVLSDRFFFNWFRSVPVHAGARRSPWRHLQSRRSASQWSCQWGSPWPLNWPLTCPQQALLTGLHLQGPMDSQLSRHPAMAPRELCNFSCSSEIAGHMLWRRKGAGLPNDGLCIPRPLLPNYPSIWLPPYLTPPLELRQKCPSLVGACNHWLVYVSLQDRFPVTVISLCLCNVGRN